MDWLTIVVGSITGFFGFLSGQKLQAKQVENQSLINLEKSIEIYKEIIDDMRVELSNLKTEIDKLEKKVQELLKENAALKELMLKHDANTKPQRRRKTE